MNKMFLSHFVLFAALVPPSSPLDLSTSLSLSHLHLPSLHPSRTWTTLHPLYPW